MWCCVPDSFEIKGALVVEQAKIAENILLDFFGLRLQIDFLQFADNFLHGVFPVAARNNFKTGAIEAQDPFGHQENALLIVFSEAAAGRETRIGKRIGCHAITGPCQAGAQRSLAFARDKAAPLQGMAASLLMVMSVPRAG